MKGRVTTIPITHTTVFALAWKGATSKQASFSAGRWLLSPDHLWESTDSPDSPTHPISSTIPGHTASPLGQAWFCGAWHPCRC